MRGSNAVHPVLSPTMCGHDKEVERNPLEDTFDSVAVVVTSEKLAIVGDCVESNLWVSKRRRSLGRITGISASRSLPCLRRCCTWTLWNVRLGLLRSPEYPPWHRFSAPASYLCCRIWILVALPIFQSAAIDRSTNCDASIGHVCRQESILRYFFFGA